MYVEFPGAGASQYLVKPNNDRSKRPWQSRVSSLTSATFTPSITSSRLVFAMGDEYPTLFRE